MNVVPIQTEQPDEVTVSWETFYLLYPRHEARKDGLKAWNALTPADQLRAIVAIAAWRKPLQDRGIQYCPLPASWLRGERFWDELPADNVPMHASHVPATSTPLPERGQIPDHIKAMLQRIKQGAR